MFRNLLRCSAAVLLLAASQASAVVINHASIAGVASLPQSTMDAIGQQKWFFTHASVGDNMVNGINTLHGANSTRYQLYTTDAGATPPLTTKAGVICEYDRGNPGWAAKFSTFKNAVDAGWRSPKVGFAMDKLCYIDQTANSASYIQMMSGLETAYPSTMFVYTTMPLMATLDSDNVLRNQYNTAVRNHCISNNKLLFDIADIEAYSPSGVASTFVSGGTTYQMLYNGYASDAPDGAHLNATGQQQVALGWYATAAAAVVPEPGAIILLLTGGAVFLAARLAKESRSEVGQAPRA